MRAREFIIKEDWTDDLATGAKGLYNKVFGGESFSVKMPASSRGADVKNLQQGLEALGYSVGPHGIDGIIGPDTQAAITKYQTDNGIQSPNPATPSPGMIASINQQLKSKPEVLTKLKPATDSPSGGRTASPMKPLSQDSVTQGKLGQILNFIAKYESNGNYNIILGGKTAPLTTMTIAQVYNLQDQMKAAGRESTAVGRYQFIKGTLAECVNGLNLDINKTLFDEKTQDALIIYRLRATRGLDNWLNGSMNDEQFLTSLSKEFASMPSPAKGGGSFYAGVGSNKAGTNLQTALNTLSDIKSA